VFAAVVAMYPAQAWAEACPESPPEDAIARRSLAKEWFTKAESSEASGDREAAVRQYSCSLRLVPHPATAYNLGTAAERSGDLSLASDAFRAYLKLLPDAPDRTHIEARIARLDADVADLRRQIYLEKSQANAPPAKSPATAEADVIGKPSGTDSPPQEPARSDGHRTAGWIMVGGGVAALATGVVFNVVARNKMKTCRDVELRAKSLAVANDACDIARPFAYGSYALFGLAAALTATGVGMLVWSGSGADVTVSPAPVGGVSALVLSGRF
jgi:tetratricopeptide (TPR) repeat protein